jgi:hypothetical protein
MVDVRATARAGSVGKTTGMLAEEACMVEGGIIASLGTFVSSDAQLGG